MPMSIGLGLSVTKVGQAETPTAGLLASLADGTNDYIYLTSGLTDSKLITVNVWFYLETGNDNGDLLISNQSQSFYFALEGASPNSKMRFVAKNSIGTTIAFWQSASVVSEEAWHNLVVSIDLGSGIGQARLDGVDEDSGFSTLTDDTMVLSGDIVYYANRFGPSKINARASEQWIFGGVQVDLDSYLNDFWGGGTPPYLGAVGELPGGAGQPHVYTPDGGVENLGTLGGTFTEVGALESVDGPGA